MSRTHLTQQQIDSLAASFLPAIKKFFQSEEGKAMYQKYLDEKAELAKLAESEKDNNDNDAVQNKLDKEIALEQEKHWKQNMRLLGEKVVSLIDGDFKQEQYAYMLEYVFEMDEVKKFIADEKAKLKMSEESADTSEKENLTEADSSPNSVST